MMKGSFVLAALMAAATAAKADYVMNLSSPAYEVDKTIYGVDGWEPRLPTPNPNFDSARVVAVRWNDYKPALLMRTANLKRVYPATTADKVNISFQIAFSFPDGARLRECRMIFPGAPIGELFFDHTAGLGYNGLGTAKGGTVVLPKEEIRLNSFYKYDLVLDYKNQSYDITISGTKRDGSPLRYEQRGVEFQVKDKPRSKSESVMLLTGPRVAVYLADLKIESR